MFWPVVIFILILAGAGGWEGEVISPGIGGIMLAAMWGGFCGFVVWPILANVFGVETP